MNNIIGYRIIFINARSKNNYVEYLKRLHLLVKKVFITHADQKYK